MNKKDKKICDRNSDLGLILIIILGITGIGLGSGSFLCYSLGAIIIFESIIGLYYKKIKAFYAPIAGGSKYLSGTKAKKYIIRQIILAIILMLIPTIAKLVLPKSTS